MGYKGETGDVVFSGGGDEAVMKDLRCFSTGVVARGRIYLAGDDKVYAFAVPTPTSNR